MTKDYNKQRGFALIVIIVAVLVIAVIAFGAMNWKGQVEQSKQIKNQAIKDLNVINDNLKNNNQTITDNLPEEPVVVDTTNWKTFTNDRYGFIIKYPSNALPFVQSEVDFSSSALKNLNQIIISDDNGFNVRVEAKDLSYYRGLSSDNPIIKTTKLDLKSYVEKIWELNSKDRQGILSEVTIVGTKGYKFTTLDGYIDEIGSEAYKVKQNFIFIEHNGIKFVFQYADNNISKAALDSFKFIK